MTQPGESVLPRTEVSTAASGRERKALPWIRAQAGRSLSLVFLLLAIWCYASLVRFSSLPIIGIQAVLFGLSIWRPRLPLYFLGATLFLFGDQPGGIPGEEHFIGPVPAPLQFVEMTLWLVVGRWLLGRFRKGKGPVTCSPATVWLLFFWGASVFSLLPYVSEYCAHFAWAGKAEPPKGVVDPLRAISVFYQVGAFGIYWAVHALLDLTLSLLFFFLSPR